jgi:hypothetical protein
LRGKSRESKEKEGRKKTNCRYSGSRWSSFCCRWRLPAWLFASTGILSNRFTVDISSFPPPELLDFLCCCWEEEEEEELEELVELEEGEGDGEERVSWPVLVSIVVELDERKDKEELLAVERREGELVALVLETVLELV